MVFGEQGTLVGLISLVTQKIDIIVFHYLLDERGFTDASSTVYNKKLGRFS